MFDAIVKALSNLPDGQQRRAWLDKQDARVTEVAKHLLGPGYAPVENVAKIGALMSPGADMVDMREQGQDLMESQDWRGAATAGAGLAAATAGMAIPGTAQGVSEGVEGAARGIRAYHGSPHDFDRFSMDKIGTGEGAQAYGHGLYFAENEAVAKGYRERLTSQLADSPIAIGKGYENDADAQRVMAEVRRLGLPADSLDGLIKTAGDRAQSLAGAGFQNDARTLGDLQYDLIEHADKFAPAGSMYEVNINANPDDFLDWDRPLHRQTPQVQERLGAAGVNTKPSGEWTVRQTKSGRWTTDNVWGEASGKYFKDEASARSYADARTDEHHTGGAGYAYGKLGGNHVYGDKGEASAKLREAGIPGIRYLDQGSRTAGDGSRNYVVFDDNLVSILKKYGLLGGLGLAGMGAAQQSPQSEM